MSKLQTVLLSLWCAIRYCACILWRAARGVGGFLRRYDFQVNWVFRVLALLGFVYLVLDRIYETSATISATGADPNDALAYPFALTNNSHLFTIRKLHFECTVVKLISKGGSTIENSTTESTTLLEVLPGKTVNFACSSYYIEGPHIAGVVQISASYKMALLPFEVKDVPFRWGGKTANPQWVRGDFVGTRPVDHK